MTITAGVVGCGKISRFHFSGLEKAGANVKWVCDLSASNAKPWADKFEAAYTADYREIIDDPSVDVVFVILISRLHKQICLEALKAGKAVVCEKTLAVSSEEAAEITSVAMEQGALLYTSYMKRFFPAVRKAKELLPQLGTLITTHVRVLQPWGNLWSEPPTEGDAWTPTGGESVVRKSYGGGILTCGGSHMLDLTLFLLGRPKRLIGSVFTPEGFDFDLRASAMMETEDNGVIHFDGIAHEMSKIGYLHDGWDERIEINGVFGRLDIYTPFWNQFDTKGARLVHHDKRTGRTTEYNFDCVSPFDLAVQHFCAQIAKGEQGDQSVMTGYEVDELISSIHRSSDLDQAIEIPWKL
jgi:predicted dehydrogenase